MANYFNVKGLRGLASFLGEPESTIYGWVKNGGIKDTGVILAKDKHINREYLITGKGPMLLTLVESHTGITSSKGEGKTIGSATSRRGGMASVTSTTIRGYDDVSPIKREFISMFRIYGTTAQARKWLEELKKIAEIVDGE